MRIIYALTILIFLGLNLNGQEIHIGPAEGNTVLRHHLNQQAVQQALEVEKRFGINPLNINAEGEFNDCPPSFFGFLLEEGDTINFDLAVDTLILGGGGGDNDQLILKNCGSLTGGTVDLDSTSLTYRTFASISSATTDSICIEFCRENGICDDIVFVITAKRRGKTVVANPQTVQRESVNLYCLDNELNFPGERKCSQFIDCDDNYLGEGQQLFSFSNYNFPDTCMIYYSNRFPGTDTVCMVICDEYVVCDTFKIPMVIIGDTLTVNDLPFFDDFSYEGPIPNGDLWLDKQAFVNRTFADSLPSLGMATLDGVSHKGDAYEIFEGVGDKLTSKPIDLSGYTPNGSEELVFKFFFAPKGFGKAPTQKDSLLVELRDENGRWVEIYGFPGIDPEPGVIDTTPAFEFRSFTLTQEYFHEGFQFRFKGKTSPGGMVDLWHIDYVWLGETIDPSAFFLDVAFTDPPPSILKTYTSMPWWHFEGFEAQELDLDQMLDLRYYNHKNFTEEITEGNSFLNEITTGTNVFNFGTSLTSNVTPGISNVVYPVSSGTLNQIESVLTNSPNFDGAEVLDFETVYWIDADQDPLFSGNDTIVNHTIFDNYFAYDDGSAERQISINGPSGGENIAVKYRTNVEDTLRAIQILFPHLNGDVSSQFFNMLILKGVESQDVDTLFEQTFQRPFYPNMIFDTIQGFTTYRLQNKFGVDTAIVLPAGDFYISIVQVTSGVDFGIPMGIDVNNRCEDCIFFKLNSLMPWTLLPTEFQNAPMIRPVFRYQAPGTTSSGVNEVREITDVMQIFPNPARDRLFINLKDGNFQDYKALVFNNVGQSLGEIPFENQIHLADYQSGIYFLQIVNRKTKERFTHKIIIVK